MTAHSLTKVVRDARFLLGKEHSKDELVEVPCTFHEDVRLKVPRYVFNGNEGGRAEERFRGKSLVNGVYISPDGNPYCCVKCWAAYCED